MQKSCGNILDEKLSKADLWCSIHASKLKIFLDIGQHNALEILKEKKSTMSEISKELQYDIFPDFDKSSAIENITDRLNLGEL